MPSPFPGEPRAIVVQVVPGPSLQDGRVWSERGQITVPDRRALHLLLPRDTPLKGPYRAPGDLLLYTMSHQLTASLKTVTEEDDRDHHLLGLLAERRGGGGGVSGLLHHHRPQPQLLRCWCVRARNKRQEPAHRQAFVLFIVVLQPPPAA